MKLTTMLVCAASMTAMALPANAREPHGLWSVRDGRARVKVDNCQNDASKLCANIVWLRADERKDAQGRPRSDRKNQNPSLRTRPIIGLPVAYDMVKSGANRWTGKVYDPEKGGEYKGYMKLLGDGRMKVTGCLVAFLCESKYWQPYRK